MILDKYYGMSKMCLANGMVLGSAPDSTFQNWVGGGSLVQQAYFFCQSGMRWVLVCNCEYHNHAKQNGHLFAFEVYFTENY